MKSTTPDSKAAAQHAIPSLRAAVRILGNDIRCSLPNSQSGEPLRVVQLAKAVSEKPDLVSKHLKVMRSARVAEPVVAGKER